MRISFLLLAASGHLTRADGFLGQEPEGAIAFRQPRQTGASAYDAANGWTPRPTDGPLVVDGANALEIARRRDEWMRMRRQESNTWINEETCGWRAGTSSSPFTCGGGLTCATNRDNVVACSSSGLNRDPFFTVCFDRNAWSSGACDNMGPKTGCCTGETAPACITYLWAGPTPLSMYRCYATTTLIAMIDEPQFVVDERTRTTSSTSSTSSPTSSSTSTTSSSTPPAETTTEAPPPPPVEREGGTNTAAIAGVVGGVAGVALIAGAISFLVIRSCNKDKQANGVQAYSAVAPGDPSYPGAGPGGMPPPGSSPQITNTPAYMTPHSVGSTLHANSPYVSTITPPPPGAYDPRQSYYDPSKMGQQHYPGSAYPAYPAVPPHQGPYPVPGQQPHMSELDNTGIPAPGQQGNPVEMAANSPTMRS